MSMAEVMREVASWPRLRQNKLAAYLLHLRLREDKTWKAEMARRIDDRNPENWVALEDLSRGSKRRRRK